MSNAHMVVFRDAEGNPGYRETASLDEAIAVVESLRNDDGIDKVRLYALTELAVHFHTYYRVEVGEAEGGSSGESSVESGVSAEARLEQPMGPTSDAGADAAPDSEPGSGDLDGPGFSGSVDVEPAATIVQPRVKAESGHGGAEAQEFGGVVTETAEGAPIRAFGSDAQTTRRGLFQR